MTNQSNSGETASGEGPATSAASQEPIRSKSASEARAAKRAAKRSRQSRNQIVVFLNFVISGVMLLVLAAGAGVYFGKRMFDGPGPSESTTTFLVKPNTGVSEIADQLERRGLISDALVFKVGVRTYGNDSALKAGEYEIKAAASMREIMELLKSGKSILYSLTIPEGLTVEQAWERIAQHEALSGEMPDTLPAEGTLAADTQRFTRGTPRKQIIDKLIADQKALIESIWEKRADDLPLADINEFVTLASIVEKETGIDQERPDVASVFINRLNKGMRLQSDPTIIYGLFGGKGKPAGRPIYRSDIDKPTPYNTYVIKGLPPTPIANPGRAALEAVANPSETDYLYFVADGTGGHVFASTLAEHNKNVARWREMEKQRAAEPEAGTGGEAAGNDGEEATTAQ